MPWSTTSSRDAMETSCTASCLNCSERDMGAARHQGAENGCEREPARELAGESEGGETERPQPQVKGQDPRAQEGPQEASTRRSAERSVSTSPR